MVNNEKKAKNMICPQDEIFQSKRKYTLFFFRSPLSPSCRMVNYSKQDVVWPLCYSITVCDNLFQRLLLSLLLLLLLLLHKCVNISFCFTSQANIKMHRTSRVCCMAIFVWQLNNFSFSVNLVCNLIEKIFL